MLAARKKIPARNGPPKPLFTSLKSGMQSLADALVARLNPPALRTKARRREPSDGERRMDCFHWGSARLFRDGHRRDLSIHRSELAAELSASTRCGAGQHSIHFISDSHFGIQAGNPVVVAPRLRISGSAQSEGKRMLAATFVHNKFPFRAPEERALIRCFLGGVAQEQMLQLSDDEIVRIVCGELRQILRTLRRPALLSRVQMESRDGAIQRRHIWSGWSASNACAASCPVWRWRATAIAASACRIAFAPVRPPQRKPLQRLGLRNLRRPLYPERLIAALPWYSHRSTRDKSFRLGNN